MRAAKGGVKQFVGQGGAVLLKSHRRTWGRAAAATEKARRAKTRVLPACCVAASAFVAVVPPVFLS